MSKLNRLMYATGVVFILISVGVVWNDYRTIVPAKTHHKPVAQAAPSNSVAVVPPAEDNMPAPPEAKPEDTPPPSYDEYTISNIIALVNEVRAGAGESPVTENGILDASAMLKARDLCDNDYWAHENPKTGYRGLNYMKDIGYEGVWWGENLAEGFPNATSMVSGWANSASHYEQMTKPLYTETGVAILNCDTYLNSGSRTIVVQHFGGY